MFRLRYTLETTLSAVREAPGLSVLTVVTIGTALVVLGGYVAGLQNLENLALTWGRSAAMSAYLVDDSSEGEWQEALQHIRQVPEVKEATLLSPEQALEAFRAQGSEAAALVAGIQAEILPASIEIELASAFADLATVERIAKTVAAVRSVAEVDYGQEEFERLGALLELLRIVGLGAGLFVFGATAFIISNTIRLTVFARRDELRILSLVGATDRFIRAPFLLEGAIWGFGGGVTAVVTLLVADALVAPRLSVAVQDILGGLEVSLFTPAIAGAILLAGVALGVLGSSLAVSRFLVDGESA